MITLNDDPVKIDNFPDGTILMKCPKVSFCRIRWTYENDREFLALIYLVKHLRSNGYSEIALHMPYIPNARQDRVKNSWDVFTLKYFAELLNNLKLDYVRVLDPHSSVSEALIDNLSVETPERYVQKVLDKLPIQTWEVDDYLSYEGGVKQRCSLTAFYPDEGAMKRYSGMINLPSFKSCSLRNDLSFV